jgi:antitoxin component YwqK of YwqJK toxin-antitoxin module
VAEYGTYKNDKLDGDYYIYHPNGLIKSEIEYNNGKIISKIEYNEEGEKISSEK